jgi:hypothetical protein
MMLHSKFSKLHFIGSAALILALNATFAKTYAEVPLSTHAERTGFRETGRYDEVETLCRAFARTHPAKVRCFSFGTTPESRPMYALAVSASGALTAGAARQRGLPVVLVQGGIHSGEIDGKDATFGWLKDWLAKGAAPPLKGQVLVFVPVFNIDGHERFGRWNRPNQRGPLAMGWRTTAQNYNLNREYLRADAPEMRAMHALVQAWDPLAVIDLHVTNGAQFEHDVSIQVEPLYAGDAELRVAGKAFRDGVIADLAKSGSLPLPFYPAFIESDNPLSGVRDGVAPPRLSHGYFWLRNRFGMLVETHSWKDYPTRVRVTRNVVDSVLTHTARHGAAWRRLAHAADQRTSRLGGTSQPLTFRTTDTFREMDYRGYAFTRTPSEISGALMTRYDETRPEIWRIKVRDEVVPDELVRMPRGGYIVPSFAVDRVRPLLTLHGVSSRLIRTAASVPVEAFRASQVQFTPASVENRQRLTVQGQWQPETRAIPVGSLWVPIHQPLAPLIAQLLEPRAPDSMLAWGHFNIHFERREYMEPYVAEVVAREMLAKDPELKAAFAKRLADDPEFAKSPSARLDFFYQRHPSWDERLNLYPIYRTDEALR